LWTPAPNVDQCSNPVARVVRFRLGHVAKAGLADLEKTPGLNAATAKLVYDFFYESRAR
jgi:hypothetical protein